MKKYRISILYFVCGIFMLSFVGCKNKVQTPIETDDTNEEDDFESGVIHTDMEYFDFDAVADLSQFFDSIANEHGIPIRDLGDEDSGDKLVFDCIKRIEQYRNGIQKFYPDSLVRRCIDMLGGECAYLDNHACYVNLSYAEWFLMLVAYYSPDITYLVDMQTPNHRAGVLNFGSTYNFSPWWSYLFFKRHKGYEVRMINGDDTRIDKIFQMSDEDGQTYYLCSNNMGVLYFLQVLYWEKSEDELMTVAQCDRLNTEDVGEFEEFYYNPDEKAWYCCNRDKLTDKLIPVSETPILVIDLDKDKSRFISE